jgi:hypothetical protein
MIGKFRKDVGEPDLRVDVVQLACFDQRVDGGSAMASRVRTCNCPIGATDGNLLFILPMSGKRSRSITAGIHCMGAMFDSNTVSSVPVAGLFTLRRRPG